jgi:hypothetical protein
MHEKGSGLAQGVKSVLSGRKVIVSEGHSKNGKIP